MTVTYNTTTEVVTIESDNIEVADFAAYDTVTLTSKKNCTGSEYSVEIESGDITGGNQYVIDNATFFGSATLSGGVYSFKLTIDKTDSTKIVEEACLFVDKIHCDVATQVQNERDVELMMDYYILKEAASSYTCCDCQALCNIYIRLTNELNCCTGC